MPLVSESGVALGIVDQVIWTRDEIRADLSRKEKGRLGDVVVDVVEAVEIDPPDGEEPIH